MTMTLAQWDAALIAKALQDAAIQACLAAGAPDLATAERWLDDAEINIGE